MEIPDNDLQLDAPDWRKQEWEDDEAEADDPCLGDDDDD